MDDRSVICAREPFTWGTEAIIVTLTDDFRVPEESLTLGFKYFLGKEDVGRLLGMLDRKRVSDRTRAEFVSHFAMFDAYPYWFEDLRDIQERK